MALTWSGISAHECQPEKVETPRMSDARYVCIPSKDPNSATKFLLFPPQWINVTELWLAKCCSSTNLDYSADACCTMNVRPHGTSIRYYNFTLDSRSDRLSSSMTCQYLNPTSAQDANLRKSRWRSRKSHIFKSARWLREVGRIAKVSVIQTLSTN